MERSTIIAGFGGQGILFAGKVLAEAALLEGREVLWIPSYGPEMRGGTASCTIIVADRPIGSPIVDRADHAVVLNPPSMAQVRPARGRGGPAGREHDPHRGGVGPGRHRGHRGARAPRSPGRPAMTSSFPSWRWGRSSGAGGSWSRTASTARSRSCSGRKRPELIEADSAAFDAGYEAGLEPVVA